MEFWTAELPTCRSAWIRSTLAGDPSARPAKPQGWNRWPSPSTDTAPSSSSSNDRMEPMPPRHCAGSGDVFAQLIVQDAQRQMAFDVLDRVVASVGIKRIDRIHAVLAETAAIGAFHDLHVDPGAASDPPRKTP